MFYACGRFSCLYSSKDGCCKLVIFILIEMLLRYKYTCMKKGVLLDGSHQLTEEIDFAYFSLNCDDITCPEK